MNDTQTRMTLLVQEIIAYVEELEKTNPYHELLNHVALFEDGTAPAFAEAEDFYLAFVPEDGTREDTLVEYFARLEDAIMAEREKVEPVTPKAVRHRLHEVEDAVLV